MQQVKKNKSGGAKVEVGQVYSAKIESVGSKGDGVFKIKGLVCFVPNTEKGQEVKVKITQLREKFAFGEVVEPQNTEDF